MAIYKGTTKIAGGTTIENVLTSTSTTNALSANQGKVLNDAFNVSWTSYNPTTTGWAATPTTTGTKYIKIGKTVILNFKISGTSNANTARLSLPFTAVSGTDAEIALGLARDNGTYITTACRGIIDSLDYGVVQCYKDMTSAAWTTSGEKEVRGIIIYETA